MICIIYIAPYNEFAEWSDLPYEQNVELSSRPSIPLSRPRMLTDNTQLYLQKCLKNLDLPW